MSQTQEIEKSALTVLDRAKQLTVSTQEEFALAGGFLTEVVKPMRRQIDETFDPVVESAHKAHKAAVAAKKNVLAPVDEAERVLKGAMQRFATEQERRRREQEAELRRLAQEEAERRQALEAEALAQAGQVEAGVALLEEPVVAEPVVLAPATPQVQGVSVREVWKWSLTDPAAVKREFLALDEVKIGQIVRSMKGAAEAIVGGIEVWSEKSVAAR